MKYTIPACITRGLILGCVLVSSMATTADEIDPFLGNWALTIPGGGAGWLGVTKDQGFYDASILWGGGSVMPVDSVFVNEGSLYITRIQDVQRKNSQGKVICTQRFTELLTARVEGDTIEAQTLQGNHNGQGLSEARFSGKRIPPVPSAPNLSQAKYADPIPLFNGKDLEGWKLTDAGAVSGWGVKGGILVNNPAQEEGKPHKSYGNLRTEKEFEDFNLKLEVRVQKGGNSGVYLRGIYEVQVADTYGKPLDSHNMAAIYSRIKPSMNAEKPAGEWQTMDITLLNRHVTVILNGNKIIDNQPLMGCTGGALWSDEFRPGPIYLQGDHTGIEYRNIVLRPIVK